MQLETERRESYAKRHGIVRLDYAKADNPLAGKVICGECGSLFGRKVWNSTDKKLRRVIWQCNHKYEVKGKVLCENRHVDGKFLQEGLKKVLLQIFESPNIYRKKWEKEAEGQNPLKRHQARQLIEVYMAFGGKENEDNQLSLNLIECIEVLCETLVITLIDGTKLDLRR